MTETAAKLEALRAAAERHKRRRAHQNGELESHGGRCPRCGGPMALALGAHGPEWICWCIVPRVFPKRCSAQCRLCPQRPKVKHRRGGR